MDDIITERLSKSSFLIPEGFHSIEELDDIIREGDSIHIPQYIDLIEQLYEELTMARSSQSVEECQNLDIIQHN